MTGHLRHRLFQVLEAGHPGDRLSQVFDAAMVLLILANVAAVIAETVGALQARYGAAFWAFEVVSVAVFTAEYLARLWVATEHPSLARHGAFGGRLRGACGPFMLIDLLAILPFYLALLFPILDLRVLRVFRLLRLLKLARYSPALATLWRVLVDERRALGAALIIMMGLLTLSATAIYHVERAAQPEAFGSIPSAMWWAIATLTTVGYGDVTPVTPLGRAIGGLVMLFGLAMFALPIAIVASGFAGEIHRRDFVVTWGMVARVPLFAKLDALSVSRITNLLHARVIQPGTVILRRGDEPKAMYFIASGEVEVELPLGHRRLGDGDFFGEMALLRHGRRLATVRAVSRCRLLVLDADDFHELLAADGDLRQAVSTVAEERLVEFEDLGEPEAH
ncbi:MAG: cyclic nucleotide-gated ion channel/potassium channel family protein [Rhodospirillales bacterium]|nr:cyclic nucleotide-gated ion channel/potassium channel family protein [Rhodospirillales bacterium]